MSRLAVLAVLLLGSAMLAQADGIQCQVTLSKAPDSTTVAPGSNVTMTALVECDAPGRMSPVDGLVVAFGVAYEQGLKLSYTAECNTDRRSGAAPPGRDEILNPCELTPPEAAALRQELLTKRPMPRDMVFDIVVVPTGANGKAVLDIYNPAGGFVQVAAAIFTPSFAQSDVVNVTWESPPARLSLLPHKAVRHCGQPVKITARLLRKDNTPVAGANITFGVTGDCVPKLSGKVVTTDADGYATLHLFSEEPGVVAVVAAAVGADGMPLLSAASKVIFMEEGHDEGYYREDAAKDHKHADAASKQAVAEIQAQHN